MLQVIRIGTTRQRKWAATFVNKHHSYIEWADRPSRKLYWSIVLDGRMVGVWGLGSAFAFPKAVKNFMAEHRLRFNEVGNNIVYALAPHTDKNLGSRILRCVRMDAIRWWKERYGDDLRAFQTFILPPRTGAVYKADNWQQLGATTGGRTMSIRTLSGEDVEKHPNAERRVFRSGEVRYLLREFHTTTPKLIFMRLVSGKERRFAHHL